MNLAAAQSRLEDLLNPVVVGLGYELLCVEYQSHGQQGLLRLYIDSPDGIGLDDCEAVSREVSAVLDVEDPIGGAYRLEVSSPGADRPLAKPEHFQKFVGSEAKVRLSVPQDGRSNFKGRITDANDSEVMLDVDGETVSVRLDSIERARLVPEFE